MAKETPIEWCDSTVNPSSGCDGCELWNGSSVRLCYAGILHESRLAKSCPDKYAASFSEVRMIPGRLSAAANWPDLSGVERPDKPWLNGRRRHIFVGDMGDFMSRAITDDFLRREVFDVMVSPAGSRHVWMLLTKIIARLADLSEKMGGLPDNCIAMTTVTNQRTADLRVPHLLRVKCKTRGISAEPLRGAVDFNSSLGGTKWMGGSRGCTGMHRGIGTLDCPLELHHHHDDRCQKGIDWIVTGGASGSDAAPAHPDWFRSLRDQCAAAMVPFFLKQWGEWCIADEAHGVTGYVMPESGKMPCGKPACWIGWDGKTAFPSATGLVDPVIAVARMGKAKSGRLLDGVEHNGFPSI